MICYWGGNWLEECWALKVVRASLSNRDLDKVAEVAVTAEPTDRPSIRLPDRPTVEATVNANIFEIPICYQ